MKLQLPSVSATPLKRDIKELKSNLDILEVAQKYCELKKVSNNDFMAVINPLRDEKTSSLHFYMNTQRFYDYGSSEGGDVLDFIAKVENISLSDVIKKISDTSFTPSIVPIREKPQQVAVIEISSQQLGREFNQFQTLNINNPQHHTELLNVIPYWLYETANKEDLGLFKALTRYDSQNNTLVAQWCKNSVLDFEIVTYKRRRLNGGKWINRKDTHPNQTSFSRIYSETKPIYIIEGMRDALTAVLLGLNFIAIPTTSFKNFEDINSVINKDDEVVLLCEDMQGYKAMKLIEPRLHTKNVRLICLISSKNTKIDLSDFVMQNKSIEGVLNVIK
jgi:hypothetical protein